MKGALKRKVDSGMKKILIYKSKIEGKPRWLDFPTVLQFDTCRKCNLACVYCNPQNAVGYDVEDQDIYMDFNLIMKILKEAGDRRMGLSWDSIRPFMNGEPLLEHRLPIITQMIKDMTNGKVCIYTNGSIFQKRDLLRDSNIDEVRFTISACTRETYEAVHGRDRFKDAVNTLLWFKENKHNNQRVFVNFVMCQENKHEYAHWLEMMKGFEVVPLPLHYSEGQGQSIKNGLDTFAIMDDAEIVKAHKNKSGLSQERPCNCWHSIAIMTDGTVPLCVDLPRTSSIGNVRAETIKTIWGRKMAMGLNNKYCNSCNYRAPNWRAISRKYGLGSNV